jgi:hypothetical protein
MHSDERAPVEGGRVVGSVEDTGDRPAHRPVVLDRHGRTRLGDDRKGPRPLLDGDQQSDGQHAQGEAACAARAHGLHRREC